MRARTHAQLTPPPQLRTELLIVKAKFVPLVELLTDVLDRDSDAKKDAQREARAASIRAGGSSAAHAIPVVQTVEWGRAAAGNRDTSSTTTGSDSDLD
jgi:hypothetical protein